MINIFENKALGHKAQEFMPAFILCLNQLKIIHSFRDFRNLIAAKDAAEKKSRAANFKISFAT